jgi:hypothetical protein
MKRRTSITQRVKACFIPHVSTRFSTNSRKVDLVWKDENKTQVEFVNNENGKYIIGCDPAFIPNLWQKIWMMFGFYKKHKSHSSILRINDDGSLYHVK